MIYLIGGPPRCGKTIISTQLAKATHVPLLPIDYLTAAIYQYIPDEKFAEKFPLTAIREEGNKTTDEIYETVTAQDVVRFLNIQSESVWPAVKAVIEYALHEEKDLILEGCQLVPEFISTLITDANSHLFRVVFLVRKNQKMTADNIQSAGDQKDWLIQTTHKKETFDKVAKMILLFSEEIEQKAKKENFHVFSMDENFANCTQKVLKYLER